jgi:cell division protease FtsH
VRKQRARRTIDDEIRAIVQSSYQRVKELLQENRPVLDSLASELEEKEVLSGEEVDAIIKEARA